MRVRTDFHGSTMRLAILAPVFMLIACSATPEDSKTNVPAPAGIDPGEVRFFIDTQAVNGNYDLLGHVSAQRTARTAGEPVEDAELIADMKQQAARLGANAIVLESLFTNADSSLVSGFKDTVERKRARALAIRLR